MRLITLSFFITLFIFVVIKQVVRVKVIFVYIFIPNKTVFEIITINLPILKVGGFEKL